MFFSKRKIIIFLLAACLFILFKNFAYATESNVEECRNNKISAEDCESYIKNKINLLQGQAKTLSSQIAIMNSQIYLTQARIEANKREILNLSSDIDTATKKIEKLQDSLKRNTEIWIKRIVASYKAGNVQPIEMLLSAHDASNLLTRLNYLRIVKKNDEKSIIDVQQSEKNYANQKDIFEEKRKKVEALKLQLEAYTNQLNQEKQTKQDLLVQTEGSEENYQRLLAQAQAQLAAFSSFAAAKGGASILSNQTVCDDGWSGCYYNQRDSQWGNLALNNTQYTIASDGCLVTSMAMVYSHYGHRNVNPISINSNSSNFASYFPAYLKYVITADGATTTRVGAAIDSMLSSGEPVVVGVSYDGGPIPDHFVVLISGSSGNYKMNDPFTPDGHNVPFTDHYSVSRIREIDKVLF